jgi:hypothetical protein
MLFCALVIVSTIGSSFGIKNSYAQPLHTQQPSILTYNSPWINKLQALCGHGVCNTSSGSDIMPITDTGNILHHNATISSSLAFTNSKCQVILLSLYFNKHTKLQELRNKVDGMLRLQSKTALDDDTWRACMKILNDKGLIAIWS